jgi:hypothetical protein
MKNKKLAERKQELKDLSEQIRKDKREHGFGYGDSEGFRYRHIAYCMARGRKYLEIENKVHECNVISKYRWEIINKDIAELQEGFNEDVCISA